MDASDRAMLRFPPPALLPCGPPRPAPPDEYKLKRGVRYRDGFTYQMIWEDNDTQKIEDEIDATPYTYGDTLKSVLDLFDKKDLTLPPTPPKEVVKKPKRVTGYGTRRFAYRAPNKTKVRLLNKTIKENAQLIPTAFKTIRDYIQQANHVTEDFLAVQRVILGEVIRRANPQHLTDQMIRRTCKNVYSAVYTMYVACRIDELTDEAIDAANFQHRTYHVNVPLVGKNALEIAPPRGQRNDPKDKRKQGVWVHIAIRDGSVLRIPIALNKFTQRQLAEGTLVAKEVTVFTRRLPDDHPDYWFEQGRRSGQLAAYTGGEHDVVYLGDEQRIECSSRMAEDTANRLKRPLTVMVEGRQLCGTLVFSYDKESAPGKPVELSRVESCPAMVERDSGKSTDTATEASVMAPEFHMPPPRTGLYKMYPRSKKSSLRYIENIDALFYGDRLAFEREVLRPAEKLMTMQVAVDYQDALDRVAEEHRRTLHYGTKVRSNRMARARQNAKLRELPGRNGFLSNSARRHLDAEYLTLIERRTLIDVASLLATLDQRVVESLLFESADVYALQRYVYAGYVYDTAPDRDPNDRPVKKVAETVSTPEKLRQWQNITEWLTRSMDGCKVAAPAKELMRWLIEWACKHGRAQLLVWD
jgi:hypothetical protein